MSQDGVRVTLNISAARNRIETASKKAMNITSQQALKDCNYYCKQDQGPLIASSIINSDLNNGKLIWKTPYAKKQYYLKATRHEVNANAEWMWAHKAAAKHKKEWHKIYEQAFKQFSRGD